MPATTVISRRRLLQLGAVTSAGLATGCAGGTSGDLDERAEGQRLQVLNWSDYIDPTEDATSGTVDRFVGATGIDATYDDTYPGNFEALADLFEPTLGQGKPSGWDIAVPTYWLAQRMLAKGWLERIPQELVPNHVNLDPAFLGMPWDRGARFHLPWQVGITGIAYDPRATGGPLTSLADFFALAESTPVSFIGEMREAVGLAMLAAGQDPSAADVDDANAAVDRLEALAARPTFGGFTFEEFSDLLSSGQVAAAMAWSGDIVQLQRDRPDLQFLIPGEGAIRWFDTMVIPAGSTNRAAAAKWMDWVYDPVNAAKITAWVQYISPVLGVREELAAAGGDLAALADDPILFPDVETEVRLRTWGGMDLGDEDALDARFADVAGL